MKVLLAIVAVAVAACAPKVQTGPLGDPLRPQAKSLPAPVSPEKNVAVTPQPGVQAPEDCEAIAPNQGQPPKKFKERQIEEGQTIAKQGVSILVASESPTLPYEEIAAKIEQAVAKLFGALGADPYNVHATYNLAAAYARIGRNQCSLNLLARLVAMKGFWSQQKQIADKKGRLFGTGTKWNGKPDPDFDKLREDPRFKEITQNF